MSRMVAAGLLAVLMVSIVPVTHAAEIKDLETELEDKLQKALDNPLSDS